MKNRALQVRLVRADAPANTGESAATIDLDQVNDLVTHVAFAVGGVLVVKKAMDTLSDLILIAGAKHL
jgi:hypothetical protein